MTDPERRRRVDELCDAALNREARERAAFVAAACGGDDALRHEVEALLAHAQTAEGFLGAPLGAVAADVLAEAPGASLVGRQIGSYTILSLLGAGGMGEVYRARDTKLGREVAIKVLPAAFTTDADRLTRLEREARLLAALNHPRIGAIYGLEEAGGVRALVLELVEGETLADWVAEGACPSRRPCRLRSRSRRRWRRRMSTASFTAISSRRTSSSRGTARSRCSTSGWRRRSWVTDCTRTRPGCPRSRSKRNTRRRSSRARPRT